MGDDPLELEQLIEPVVRAMGFDLWGLEYALHGKQAFLRVFIDREEGVTVDDCGLVSEQLSGVLDVEDPIPVAYRLEVSSPGMERPLFKAEQFQRYRGRRVKIRLKEAREGRRNLTGQLEDAGDEAVVVAVDDAGRFRVPYEIIARARLLAEV